MSLLSREARMDMLTASGQLRVRIRPQFSWLMLLLEAGGIGFFAYLFLTHWPTASTFNRALFVWAMLAVAFGWLYQVSGSEEIEIDSRNITLRKKTLGWGRSREYDLNDCKDLTYCERGEDQSYGLQVRVGWRTVPFGEYLTEAQAIEVLTALENSLPDVIARLAADTSPDKSHFTTLKLN